jgi:hypothetical protein
VRTFIIVSTSAIAVFSSVTFTQETSQGTASIPDFSGVWAAHPSAGPEPPASGPGPVLNKARRDGISDRYQWVGDYANPVLKPQAAAVVRKHGEIQLAGLVHPTPSTHCWPSALLSRPNGTTITAIMDATGWQAHSVAVSWPGWCARSSG